MERTITASARTQPNRYVELKAETEGQVVSIDVRRGAAVRAGDAIATLDMRDRNSRLEEAQALIRQRELEKCLRRMGPITAEQRQAVEQLTTGIINKVLHYPIIRLKEASAEEQGGETIRQTIRRIFGL